MNNAQRANQAQMSNPMMGGFPFLQNSFNMMPQPMQLMRPMQPLNSFFGFMPNQVPFAMPSMPPMPIPMQQSPPPMIPQGLTMHQVQPPLNMSQPMVIKSASMSIPVNPAAYGQGPQINMSGFNQNNPNYANNFSPFPQGGNFQHVYGGNRRF